MRDLRPPREGGDPVASVARRWVPPFAGTTIESNPAVDTIVAFYI